MKFPKDKVAKQRGDVMSHRSPQGNFIEPQSQVLNTAQSGVGMNTTPPHPKLNNLPEGAHRSVSSNPHTNENAERSQKERNLVPAPTAKLSQELSAVPTSAPTLTKSN